MRTYLSLVNILLLGLVTLEDRNILNSQVVYLESKVDQ
jgi:hypothetical protein